MKTKDEVKKEHTSVKKILLNVGSIAILILAAISFVFIPGMSAGSTGAPVFGSWNGEQVKYEQDSYFVNRLEAYLNQAKEYNQEVSDYVYQYYLYQSFMDSINRLAFIDYANSTGYTLSEIKVDRAMIPYFSENGKYSEKLYRSTPDNQKINLRNQISDDLIYTRYIMDYFSDEVFTQANEFADIAFGLKVSDAELAFINKMNSTSKSFDIVFFDTNNYPTNKVSEFANENSSLFNKYSFNAISVESESVAKKILSQIKNAEITFEDALTEYSKNYYTTNDGVLKNKYEYQIKATLANESDFDKLANLSIDSLSDVIKTGTGYTIYKCVAEVEPTNVNNETTINDVLDYMKTNEMGRIEDYYKAEADKFIADANSTSFDKACSKFDLTKESVSDYTLNYMNSSLIRTANTSVSQISSAYQNEDFLKTLFSLSTNQISKPIVLGKDIAVLKVTNSKSNAEAIEKLAYVESSANADQSTIIENINNSKKLKNDFEKTYSKYFTAN
jgi:hypothetical protein